MTLLNWVRTKSLVRDRLTPGASRGWDLTTTLLSHTVTPGQAENGSVMRESDSRPNEQDRGRGLMSEGMRRPCVISCSTILSPGPRIPYEESFAGSSSAKKNRA